jgi:hypothetical protein
MGDIRVKAGEGYKPRQGFTTISTERPHDSGAAVALRQHERRVRLPREIEGSHEIVRAAVALGERGQVEDRLDESKDR